MARYLPAEDNLFDVRPSNRQAASAISHSAQIEYAISKRSSVESVEVRS